MKRFVCLALFFSTLALGKVNGSNDIFSPFNTSNRCQELLNKRVKKINFIGKLEGLGQRSKKLIQLSKKQNRVNTHEQLVRSGKNIERELMTAKMNLENMEEDIIRKGCPGIQL